MRESDIDAVPEKEWSPDGDLNRPEGQFWTEPVSVVSRWIARVG